LKKNGFVVIISSIIWFTMCVCFCKIFKVSFATNEDMFLC